MANPPLSTRSPEHETATTDRTWLGDEIHDLIGHKLSLMVLHASVLELAGGPAGARATMIRETGHAAILDLREILTRITSGHIPSQRSAGRCDRGPLAMLGELVTESRDAGLPIGLRTTANLDQLPPDTAELVCDVVREALTNVHKHAGIVPTTVTVELRDSRVVIDVDNQPPAIRPVTADAGAHRGLRAMRRRLARRGGRFTHEATPNGGFRLHGELPL